MFTSIFALGIFAAILHVVSGPDHLAAVTPLVIETKHKGWRIGLFWGIGHLTGMLLIGLLFILFKDLIPVEKISNYSEQFIGLILIVIGLWAFYNFFYYKKIHSHLHVHTEEAPYVHIHHHKKKSYHYHLHSKNSKQNIFSAFGVGVIHGLAGISHFLLLLPILSFTSYFDVIQYISGFAFGTVLSMSTYTFVIGRIIIFSKRYSDKKIINSIRLTGAIFAVATGSYWIINSRFF